MSTFFLHATSSAQLQHARYDWLCCVARLAGRSKLLHLGCALSCLAFNLGRPDVPLTRRTMRQWGISREVVGQALAVLLEHDLVLVWAAPGRARRVILTEPGTKKPLKIS